MPRPLIIDESLSHRIATELQQRGKNAVATNQLGLKGADDVPLLRALARDYPDGVLVTGDDDMPADHRDTLLRTHYTFAVVAPTKGTGYEKDQWERDVIHKWAHKMELQASGTIRRYSPNGSREWRPRRRPTKSSSGNKAQRARQERSEIGRAAADTAGLPPTGNV
jgi:hypothetical protein